MQNLSVIWIFHKIPFVYNVFNIIQCDDIELAALKHFFKRIIIFFFRKGKD